MKLIDTVGKNIAINVRTQEEYDKLMKMYKRLGAGFCATDVRWDEDKEDFCIECQGYQLFYGTIAYFSDDKFKVIPFSEIEQTMPIRAEREAVMKEIIIKCYPKTADAALVEKNLGEFIETPFDEVLLELNPIAFLHKAKEMEEELKAKK